MKYFSIGIMSLFFCACASIPSKENRIPAQTVPNILDVFSQDKNTALQLVKNSRFKGYYCDVAYDNKSGGVGTLLPLTIYAKTREEAYQLCLNSRDIGKYKDSDGEYLGVSSPEDGNRTKTVTGIAVRLVPDL